VYYLTLSNMTIPILIGNVTVNPVDEPDAKAVEFDFWQESGLPFTAVM
jgi:hypothetical protein